MPTVHSLPDPLLDPTESDDLLKFYDDAQREKYIHPHDVSMKAQAMMALFDERYDELGPIYGKHVGDANIYTTGRIKNHDVVLAYMPGMGNRTSAGVASVLPVSFTGIKLALLVGICGGVPYASDRTEIVLGDIIIGDSVIEYDFGRQYPDRFERKEGIMEAPASPNREIRSFLNFLRTLQMRDLVQRQTMDYLKILQEMKGNQWKYPGILQDRLFEASYRHKHYNQKSLAECICADCHSSFDPVCQQALKSDCGTIGCAGDLVLRRRLHSDNPAPIIHIGKIASASSVMKSGEHRDQLAEKEGVIGFEMEGAGVSDSLPCMIIKGVCDYADSHKNKAWQNYAAATAASCAKCILAYWQDGSQQQPLPFERDEMFVGREDIIMNIRNALQGRAGQTSKRAALVGLGGVG
ncbi:Hypothetical protein PENO1_090830 [Penicillium occitanis (nom. inval.)]|nr:Hypothetical protein PENO1_090830 [Penicillium occitanis (nom. inval.)]PCG92429.1 hypothetical protein PENOC_092630 [Penicillium occitanis (nom. inval.)]